MLYSVLLNDLVTLLKPGGVLLAEDFLLPCANLINSDFDQAKWDYAVEALDKFNKMIVQCPDLKSTLLPIGDGLTIGIRTGLV